MYVHLLFSAVCAASFSVQGTVNHGLCYVDCCIVGEGEWRQG